LSKSCQKVVKVVKKLYKFKTSGEDDDDDDDEEEEEDWWLLDQVATTSHLVKMAKLKIGCKKTKILKRGGGGGDLGAC
jgi:hypothetical protein